MRRFALIPAVVLAFGGSPALADNGGTGAPADTIATGKSGGLGVGAGAAPRAHLFAAAKAKRPRISVRFAEPGVSSVIARVEVLRGSRVVARISLGRVRVGRTVRVRWRGGALAAGHYVVRVHAHDRWGNQLRRSGRLTGKRTLVVHGTPSSSSPPPSVPVTASGVFPIAGPWSFGEGFGADRGDHSHQGQDIAAARGLPVVSPVAGVVASTDFQKGAAGYYVVVNGNDGRSFFFAHCQSGSFGVSAGQTVAAGTGLCRVGSTGRATGPHLHFEIWVGGWRVDGNSHPVDPLPQLRAWAG
ncbi:MAG: M23 family metallopeptidase [Solirubrobacteraceae bacterium]